MSGEISIQEIWTHLQREFSGAPFQLVNFNIDHPFPGRRGAEVNLDFLIHGAGPVERIPVNMAGSRFTQYISGRREPAEVRVRFTSDELENYLVGQVMYHDDRHLMPLAGLIRAALGNLRAEGLREATIDLFEMHRGAQRRMPSLSIKRAEITPLGALTRGPTREELEADYRV